MSEEDVEIFSEAVQWETLDGFSIEESDFWGGGLKWRVHLSDADPFPSSPHAHCIAGQERHVGCKLHLGTGTLFKGRKAWKNMGKHDFHDLIEKIRPKFPNIELPIPAAYAKDSN